MTTFNFHSEDLKDEWLDPYGHLNEAYYLVPFSNATWIFQDHFGIGVPYFDDTGCALYTVETHLRYLSDVRKPATMDIETVVFGVEPKKIWFAHQMVVDGTVCSTAEFMLLHFDTREGRVTTMPEEAQTKLKEAQLEELPDWAGRQVSLAKK